MRVNKKYKNQICSTEAILLILQKYFHNWNHKLQVIFSTLLEV